MGDVLPHGSGLPPNRTRTVVTVGTFDGVHRGHQEVLTRVVECAGQAALTSVLVTFAPHPLAVITPQRAPSLLTTAEEKAELVALSGVEYMAVLPFTPTLRRYTAAEFVEHLLGRRFRMQRLVIGHDHGFGRGREGDVDTLCRLGVTRGFAVDVVPPTIDGTGHPISSSGVRRAIVAGELEAARAALGRRYALSGIVRRGDQRGRTLGYPTLNIVPPPEKLLPPDGVYAVIAQTPAGSFAAMMHLGPRPTFGDGRPVVEAHLLDADVDLYAAHVRLDLVARLRDVRAFTGPAELIAQLGRDAGDARRALTPLRGPGKV